MGWGVNLHIQPLYFKWENFHLLQLIPPTHFTIIIVLKHTKKFISVRLRENENGRYLEEWICMPLMAILYNFFCAASFYTTTCLTAKMKENGEKISTCHPRLCIIVVRMLEMYERGFIYFNNNNRVFLQAIFQLCLLPRSFYECYYLHIFTISSPLNISHPATRMKWTKGSGS